MGGIPIATVLSSRTGLPALFVRKKAKEYGTCKLAEGPDVAGRRITLVEDVITTGGAVRDATSALREPARPWRSWSARSTAARRARTRSPTSASRCARCSPRPTSTPPRAAGSARRLRQLVPAGRLGVVGGRLVAVASPAGCVVATAAVTTTRSRPGPPRTAGSPGSRSRCSRAATGTLAAQEVAEQGDADDPQHGADEAPHEEPAPLHPGHAGHDGDVGADERHEPADHQRLVAVLVEERLGLVEVLAS